MAGVQDPLSCSLRELLAQLEGARKEGWMKLSSLMALVHNCWASSPKQPAEFNPTVVTLPGIGGGMISAAKGAWLNQ